MISKEDFVFEINGGLILYNNRTAKLVDIVPPSVDYYLRFSWSNQNKIVKLQGKIQYFFLEVMTSSQTFQFPFF